MTIDQSLAAQDIMEDIKNRKYNPLNDVLFKFIFGKEERKQVTIDFLNAVLDRKGKNAIKDIHFRNSEIIPLFDGDKLTRLDIFCVTEKGERIDVEVQIVNQKNMERRTLFYWAQMYLMSLGSGGLYQDLRPCITINILRYNIFPGTAAHSMYSIYNMAAKRRLSNDMELHFLEVPKFQMKPIKDMTRMERWFAYFSNKLDEKERKELAMKDIAIQTAMDAAAIFMQDSNERLAYLNREMAIMDYESDRAMWTAEGRSAGRAEGKAEEREVGIKALISAAKTFAASPAQAAEQLIKSYSLTEDEAQAIVKANW